MVTLVDVTTDFGMFRLALEEDKAPATVANFLAYCDGGYFDGCHAYRIVTAANTRRHDVPIEVIEWGWQPPESGAPRPFPDVAHEPTSLTGLRHRDMTISMGRGPVGTAGPAAFICIGDQPELDEGGRRNADGAGFAAFGRVIEGRDVIMEVFGQAEAEEYLLDGPVFSKVARAG